jgi:hypothetical protein
LFILFISIAAAAPGRRLIFSDGAPDSSRGVSIAMSVVSFMQGQFSFAHLM